MVLLAVVSTSSFLLWGAIIDLIFTDFSGFSLLRLEFTRIWLATFIISFPILIALIKYLEKNNQIVDWARATAFFISAAIIIIDAIVVLSFFFSNGVTSTFISKAIVIFVLAFLILGYNLNSETGFIAGIPNRIKIIKYTSVVIGVVCVFWIGSLIDILHAKNIKTDRAVVNGFANAVTFIEGHSRFVTVEGIVSVDNAQTPPSNSEFLERINYCKTVDDRNKSECYPGFPEAITYKRINDTTFSLCGEIMTSISIKLIGNKFQYHDYKFIGWDGETACFEVPYPITKDYSRGALYY